MCKPQKTVLTGPKIARLDSISKSQAMQEETLNVPKRNYFQQVKPSGLWAKFTLQEDQTIRTFANF